MFVMAVYVVTTESINCCIFAALTLNDLCFFLRNLQNSNQVAKTKHAFKSLREVDCCPDTALLSITVSSLQERLWPVLCFCCVLDDLQKKKKSSTCSCSEINWSRQRGEANCGYSRGSREGQFPFAFIERRAAEGQRGRVGVGASSNPEGAKWCIPAYGTVQTTDGGSLSFNSNQTSVPLPASICDSWRTLHTARVFPGWESHSSTWEGRGGGGI